MDEIRASNRGRLKFCGIVSEASRFASLQALGLAWLRTRRYDERKRFAGLLAKSTNLYRQVEIICVGRLFV